MSNPWSSGVKFSRGFLCCYCNKKRVGAFRWVDGVRSCAKCNRAYDPPKAELVRVYSIDCPMCHGKGKLTNNPDEVKK